ncbi:unnamed protein product [Closterium sp. Naga37s-1]|nr:unnamed protein product [Closterium sp. Naga37s-1]
MKNKYYRLQNRLDRSAVCSKEQLPEWYVLMDTVMERDEFHLRSARKEILPTRRRGRPPKSRGRPAAAPAVPKRERVQGDLSDDDLNPLDDPLDDTEAYSFPALPTLPTAANARTLQYPSPALPTLRTVAVTEAQQYVSPPPRFAREVSALYTPTAAAALPLKAGAASAPGATGASAAVGQAVAAATAAGALALAVLGASNPLRGVAPIVALTSPPAAQDDRLTSPASAGGDKLTSPASAEDDDRLASPPSARDGMRGMSPPITRGGRKMAAGLGPTGWRRGRWGSGWREREGFAVNPGVRSHLSARRTAGRTGLMAAEGLGDVMDEAVENAFADFEGLTQEWVERACGEFEGMVADMAERACLQFRSAAREFSESWKAGQDYKRRRRF